MEKDINKYRNENELIICKCGCKKEFWKYDKSGRERKFILGHHNRLMSLKERKRRGELMMGEKNPAKRPEVREKISKNRTGIPISEEQKERLRKMNIGRKLSEEHKKSIGKAMSGRIITWGDKISKSKKGHEVTDFTRIKMSTTKQGIPVKQWKKFIHFEPYDENFNIQFKNKIRQRDNRVCMNCGIHREKLTKALDVHHIDYNKKLSIPQNCISLCHPCHSLTQTNRLYWIKLFQEKLLKLYGYKYSEDRKIVLELNLEKTNKDEIQNNI